MFVGIHGKLIIVFSFFAELWLDLSLATRFMDKYDRVAAFSWTNLEESQLGKIRKVGQI